MKGGTHAESEVSGPRSSYPGGRAPAVPAMRIPLGVLGEAVEVLDVQEVRRDLERRQDPEDCEVDPMSIELLTISPYDRRLLDAVYKLKDEVSEMGPCWPAEARKAYTIGYLDALLRVGERLDTVMNEEHRKEGGKTS